MTRGLFLEYTPEYFQYSTFLVIFCKNGKIIVKQYIIQVLGHTDNQF